MTSTDVVAMVCSAPFAGAITALLRKRYPQIDGWWVVVVVALLSTVGAVLGYYRSAIPEAVWVAASPALLTLLTMGTAQGAAHVASKAVSKTIQVVDPESFSPREAPTKPDIAKGSAG